MVDLESSVSLDEDEAYCVYACGLEKLQRLGLVQRLSRNMLPVHGAGRCNVLEEPKFVEGQSRVKLEQTRALVERHGLPRWDEYCGVGGSAAVGTLGFRIDLGDGAEGEQQLASGTSVAAQHGSSCPSNADMAKTQLADLGSPRTGRRLENFESDRDAAVQRKTCCARGTDEAL